MDKFFYIFEIVGTVAFALSGAVKGIRKNMDLFGVAILGLVTGVGGGVMRDSILGNTPAVAFESPFFTLIALSTAIITFAVVRLLWKRVRDVIQKYDRNVMFVADTLGLAVFTITGIRIAKECGIDSFVSLMFIGVITGVGGGVLRDVFCVEVPDVFKKHIYAVASAAGGAVNILLDGIVSEGVAVISGFMCVVALRFLAAYFRWNLPKINPEILS